MLRRFLLIGVFVVVRPGSIQQLAYATFVTLIYLAIQLVASPFRKLEDNFMAATSSLALSMLFVLCLLYKYGALTQLDGLQEVMSLELRDDYVVSYTSFSGVLWLVCMSTFVFLGILVAKLSADEALYRARVRRLLYLDSSEEVPTPQDSVRSAARLQELINSRLLYKTNSHGYVIEEAAPLPTAGPFHVFLSHSAQRYDSSLQLPHMLLLPSLFMTYWQIGSTRKRRCASSRRLFGKCFQVYPCSWSEDAPI